MINVIMESEARLQKCQGALKQAISFDRRIAVTILFGGSGKDTKIFV